VVGEPSYHALAVTGAGGSWLLDEVLRFQSEVRSRMLTYAHACSRMLTYAHVCSRMLGARADGRGAVAARMLTYADVC